MHTLRITRRGVQIALGLLWLLDGALQLQHQMFSSNFANSVLAPAAQGQPTIVSGPMHFCIHIILLHPAIFDACFALIQLGLGVAILWKRTTRYGLIASVVWGLVVWFLGEGLGGMASGHATLLMGAPGAAVIYALLALAVLPSKKTKSKAHTQPAYWLAVVWAMLWIGGAIFQLLPGQNSVSDISSMIAGNASGAPGWLAALDNHVGNVINGFGTHTTSMAGMHMTANQMAQMQTQSGSGYWFILLLASVQLLIGLAIFKSGITRKLAIALGIILSLCFWFVGQSLGAYFSGLATDPSTAPLFILLGIAILGCTDLDQHLAKLYKHIEEKIV
jgi:hypothetical protein